MNTKNSYDNETSSNYNTGIMHLVVLRTLQVPYGAVVSKGSQRKSPPGKYIAIRIPHTIPVVSLKYGFNEIVRYY